MSRWTQKVATIFTGSVQRQLIWGVALVHAVMMSLFVYDLSQRQREFLIESQASQALALANNLRLIATTPLLSSDLAGLQELTLTVKRYPGVAQVMVMGADGKILAHGDPSRRGQYPADFSRLSASQASQEILQKSPGQADAIAAIVLNGQRLGWVRVVVSLDETASQLAGILRAGLIYTTAAIIAGILLAWALAKRLTSGLNGLMKVADSVSLGDLKVRAQVGGTDELSRLGMAFNFMLNALESRTREEDALKQALRAEKELAQVTLSSIGDAVVTTCPTGTVTFMNDSARSLTGVVWSEAVGKPVAEVFPLLALETKLPIKNPALEVLEGSGNAGKKPSVRCRSGAAKRLLWRLRPPPFAQPMASWPEAFWWRAMCRVNWKRSSCSKRPMRIWKCGSPSAPGNSHWPISNSARVSNLSVP